MTITKICVDGFLLLNVF